MVLHMCSPPVTMRAVSFHQFPSGVMFVFPFFNSVCMFFLLSADLFIECSVRDHPCKELVQQCGHCIIVFSSLVMIWLSRETICVILDSWEVFELEIVVS